MVHDSINALKKIKMLKINSDRIQCKTCKSFAVPLTADEKAAHDCQGAKPRSDPWKGTCQLEGK
nr:hypothetical protein [Candidatus Sigynarchaeota archaeon]